MGRGCTCPLKYRPCPVTCRERGLCVAVLGLAGDILVSVPALGTVGSSGELSGNVYRVMFPLESASLN